MLYWTLVSFLFLEFSLNPLPHAKASSSNFIPGRVPLGIRSPYFNSWIDYDSPIPAWPYFWRDYSVGAVGLTRIDGVSWAWLGYADAMLLLRHAIVADLEITPTRTIYTFHAGPMDLIVTYFSPIEPNDPAKQSFPFIYISVEAKSTDGKPHNVQMYFDVTAEWCSSNLNDTMTWSTDATENTLYHTFQLQQPSPLKEIDDRAKDAIAYIATPNELGVTSRIDIMAECRAQFGSQGSLNGTIASNSGILGSTFLVYAFARDLGNITNTESPIVWALGIVRNPAVSYTTGLGQLQTRAPYFLTQYGSIQDAIDAFFADFANASRRAIDLDDQILHDASAVSSKFADLVSLGARQTIGSTELTVSKGTDGQWNMSDVKLFMKDVGVSQRANPVEVLYASFSFFLYLNSSYGGQLLTPLLEFQDSPQWTQPYAARDLGSTYPQVTGNNTAHSQGVEQSGNMLIMCLSHAQLSNDWSLVHQHYDLLKGWTNYLVDNALTPTMQSTADSSTSQTNSTNLAIKGIIGIRAMAEMSREVGRNDDSQHFSELASTYLNTWKSLSLSPDGQHIVSKYGDQFTSWSLIYNLYADKILQLNFVDADVYELTENYYKSLLLSATATAYGLPLDSVSYTQTNAAWTLLAAASMPDPAVRNGFINPVWSRANISTYFPSVYGLDPTSSTISGFSSPVMGAMFSLLGIHQSANQTNSSTSSPNPSNPNAPSDLQSAHRSIVGPVVGGVAGGLALLVIAVLGTLLWKRRSRNNSVQIDTYEAGSEPHLIPYNYNPYDPPQPRTSESPGPQAPLASLRSLLAVPAVGGLIPPSKEREAANYLNRPTASSSSGSNGPVRTPSSAREVSVEGSNSRAEQVALLEAVQNLQRAMAEMQAERVLEAPPDYYTTSGVER